MPSLLAPIIQLLFTIYYFFYFLARGKAEWTCQKGAHEGETFKIENVCCEGQDPGNTETRKNASTTSSTIYNYWRRFIDWCRELGSSVKRLFSMRKIANGLKRMSAFVVSLLLSTWQIISAFFSSLFTSLLFRKVPSKSMPISENFHRERDVGRIPSSPIASTTVPLSPPSPFSLSSPPPPPPPPPRSNRVPSSQKEDIQNTHQDTTQEKEGEEPLGGGAFYSTRVFNTRNDHKKVYPFPYAKECLKGAIAVFPPPMMEQIAGSSGNSQQVTRSEVNRTPNPTVKERLREASLTPTLKSTFEYSNGSALNNPINMAENRMTRSSLSSSSPKGWERTKYEDERGKRAKSDGPPRVSRIEDSASNEAQFIFRMHGSEHDSMGDKGISPLTETIRNTTTRPTASRATTPSILSSRVSTPLHYTRDDEGGTRYRGRNSSTKGKVGDTARSWPPPPNAEGADIGKEYFINGNGIITTACSRIVQKKNEESWQSFDHNGLLIEEKKELSLMGDRDEMRRLGPFQAHQFSQHYSVDRDGVNRFENTHRQYDSDSLVESICRNY